MYCQSTATALEHRTLSRTNKIALTLSVAAGTGQKREIVIHRASDSTIKAS